MECSKGIINIYKLLNTINEDLTAIRLKSLIVFYLEMKIAEGEIYRSGAISRINCPISFVKGFSFLILS